MPAHIHFSAFYPTRIGSCAMADFLYSRFPKCKTSVRYTFLLAFLNGSTDFLQTCRKCWSNARAHSLFCVLPYAHRFVRYGWFSIFADAWHFPKCKTSVRYTFLLAFLNGSTDFLQTCRKCWSNARAHSLFCVLPYALRFVRYGWFSIFADVLHFTKFYEM